MTEHEFAVAHRAEALTPGALAARTGLIDLPDWSDALWERLSEFDGGCWTGCPVLEDETREAGSANRWRWLPAAAFCRQVEVGWHFGTAADSPLLQALPGLATTDAVLACARIRSAAAHRTGIRAAIGGTYPLLDLLNDGPMMPAPRRILALVDGVANFVFSAMEKDAATLVAAIQEAQWQGLAPANPSGHHHGLVARHRLTLLASRIFGVAFDPAAVHAEGFGRLDRLDTQLAHRLGYSIRYLGSAARHADGRFEIWVRPALIPSRYLLSQVRGGMEAAYLQLVDGSPLFFTGAGTDRQLLLRGLWRDTIELVNRRRGAAPASASAPMLATVIPPETTTAAFYLRFGFMSFARTLAQVTTVLANHGVGLQTVLPVEQLGMAGLAPASETRDLILLTERVAEGALRSALEAIKREVTLAGLRACLRIEGEGTPVWVA